MERLDRIEAQLDDVREELRGLRLAQAITGQELQHTLRDLREAIDQIRRLPPLPRRRLWLALAVGILGFGLGFTAHWRISQIEEAGYVQFVLPPRAPLQNLQQPAPGRD